MFKRERTDVIFSSLVKETLPRALDVGARNEPAVFFPEDTGKTTTTATQQQLLGFGRRDSRRHQPPLTSDQLILCTDPMGTFTLASLGAVRYTGQLHASKRTILVAPSVRDQAGRSEKLVVT